MIFDGAKNPASLWPAGFRRLAYGFVGRLLSGFVFPLGADDATVNRDLLVQHQIKPVAFAMHEHGTNRTPELLGSRLVGLVHHLRRVIHSVAQFRRRIDPAAKHGRGITSRPPLLRRRSRGRGVELPPGHWLNVDLAFMLTGLREVVGHL